MVALYNIVDKKILATGLQGDIEGVRKKLGERGSYITIREVDDAVVDFPSKLIIVDNYGRETVSDFLFAEQSDLNTEEYEELDRCVNTSTAPDFYVQVGKDYKLFDAYEDL